MELTYFGFGKSLLVLHKEDDKALVKLTTKVYMEACVFDVAQCIST